MPLRLVGYAAAALWGLAAEVPKQQAAAKRAAIVSLRSPGHHLSQALRRTHRRPKEMAFAMGVPTSTVFKLLHDEIPMTRELATKIAYVLDYSTADTWMTYQREWDNRHSLPR